MSWDTSPTPPLRGRLARHLGRLQQSLDAVGEQVRQAVASAVGRSMAEAVGEAVYEALRPRAGPSYPRSRSSWYSSWRDAYGRTPGRATGILREGAAGGSGCKMGGAAQPCTSSSRVVARSGYIDRGVSDLEVLRQSQVAHADETAFGSGVLTRIRISIGQHCRK